MLVAAQLPAHQCFHGSADDLVNLIEIQRLYDYNSWANERVLKSLRPIGQDVFAAIWKPVTAPFEVSLRTLLGLSGSGWSAGKDLPQPRCYPNQSLKPLKSQLHVC